MASGTVILKNRIGEPVQAFKFTHQGQANGFLNKWRKWYGLGWRFVVVEFVYDPPKVKPTKEMEKSFVKEKSKFKTGIKTMGRKFRRIRYPGMDGYKD